VVHIFALFMITCRCIMLKQLYILTTIDVFSGLEVTHQTAVPEVFGSVPDSDKDFCVCYFVVFVAFLLLSPKPLLVMLCCHFFSNAISFSILNILLSMWPILSVSRYRHSIFKFIPWNTATISHMQQPSTLY